MLEQLKYKIEQKKPVSVVYLGGSITEGTGASSPSACWASRVQNWLERSFPESHFSCQNAGIGGTDSEFGVFRLDRDVLAYEPDLVFVEFAVNDYKKEAAICLNAMEGIVRRIRERRPGADVVFVVTAMYRMEEECYSRGIRPESVQIHEQVAKHYGIPVIFVGETLLCHIRTQREDPTVYLPDLVHPNDRGYACYYREITAFLEQALRKADAAAYTDRTLPSRLGDGRYQRTAMVDAGEYGHTNFFREAISFGGRYPGYISSGRPGTDGKFVFEGCGIGLYWMIAKDSGSLRFRLDKGEWKTVSAWDTYALRFDRCHPVMLARDLEKGTHCLEYQVAEEADERSQGHFIRIAAFLVME